MSSTTSETSATRGGIRTEPGTKRIHAYLGGELVAEDGGGTTCSLARDPVSPDRLGGHRARASRVVSR